MKITNLRLGLGVPLNFPMIPEGFFDSFVYMERPDFIYLRSRLKGPIDEMRNNLVELAREAGCTSLMMLDTDMLYHSKTMPVLLSHNLPVVGALCYRRYPPFDPLIYKGRINRYRTIMNWKKGEVLEVDATGTGCLLFDMQIFDLIKPPWFKTRQNPNPEIAKKVGEDVGFCSRVRRAGIKIFVDTTVPAGHLSTFEVNHATWELYRLLKSVQQKERDLKENLEQETYKAASELSKLLEKIDKQGCKAMHDLDNRTYYAIWKVYELLDRIENQRKEG